MLNTKEKININAIVSVIIEKFGPVEKIILFGSQARDTADEYSDLDLIIIKKTNEPFIKRLINVPSLPVHADVFVYTPEEFEKMKENENPFILSALEGAKIIYEKSKA
ncbi:nucleotidyltransferase domain-containing protein [Candidatus Wolfebacteria bacterium]|nr:nucleotidyltransferase domain-containing protein [Candidatus Wolfebacteria bacterium]